MQRKNVLIISTFYPPLNHIASNRIFSFSKYLDKSKYKVFVITLDDNSETGSEYDLPEVEVHRIKNISPYLRIKPTGGLNHKLRIFYNYCLSFYWPEYFFWSNEVYSKALRIISKHNIDIMISSFGPIEPHIICSRIKRKVRVIKWIADMRDEMSTNLNISYFAKLKLKNNESLIFKSADAITAVSDPILKYFESSNKYNCLYREVKNGYDFDVTDYVLTKNKVFTLGYIGTFYKDIKPDKVFIALGHLLEKGLIEDVRIVIVGSYFNFKVPDHIAPYLVQISRVPHEKALEYMRNSDALLLIHPNNGRKGVYTGKIFEYLGMLRPIIAVVDKCDVAAKLIYDCNAGYIADFDRVDEIAEVILKAYCDWKENRKPDFNIEFIKTLHRREQVRILEKLIDELS